MKTRISRVVTKTGDDGTTGLADGLRVSKNHILVHVLGEIDELNSSLGLLIFELGNSKNSSKKTEIKKILTSIQHQLFNLGGEISIPSVILMSDKQITEISEDIHRLNKELPPLKEFILPGGSKLSSLAHISRTIARRAERNLVGLIESDFLKTNNIKKNGLPYLNRLSDFLFITARYLVDDKDNESIFWDRSNSQKNN
jgi:cob(I)alamin adenosyltransferase